jgi:tetraacyldisaccharide 4'-kinase
MGGSGKTPLVLYIARLLLNGGWRPAVISRGYRGAADERTNIVSDGSKTLMSAKQAGDEPYLIAESLAGVVVATGKKRIHSCWEVAGNYSCNVILLDDGFQHLAVARQLNFALFDVQHFAGNSRVFPGGDLREPISALHRATAFVLTGATDKFAERTQRCRDVLAERFSGKPIFAVSREYSGADVHHPSGTTTSAGTISVPELPENLFCFCGIARPQRFVETLDEHGIELGGARFFPDHHDYSIEDIQELTSAAIQAGAAGFITTAKDMTKVCQFTEWSLPLYAPRLEIPANVELDDYITSALADNRACP